MRPHQRLEVKQEFLHEVLRCISGIFKPSENVRSILRRDLKKAEADIDLHSDAIKKHYAQLKRCLKKREDTLKMIDSLKR